MCRALCNRAFAKPAKGSDNRQEKDLFKEHGRCSNAMLRLYMGIVLRSARYQTHVLGCFTIRALSDVRTNFVY